MKTELAPDIDRRIKIISRVLEGKLPHLDPSHIICMRSTGTKTRAIARIWGLPRIWQEALHLQPYYIIEAVSEKFNKLDCDDQDRTLIHELMHVPKTFSGALVPHECFGKKINSDSVEILYKEYAKILEENPHMKYV